jgi:hypothetical protein
MGNALRRFLDIPDVKHPHTHTPQQTIDACVAEAKSFDSRATVAVTVAAIVVAVAALRTGHSGPVEVLVKLSVALSICSATLATASLFRRIGSTKVFYAPTASDACNAVQSLRLKVTFSLASGILSLLALILIGIAVVWPV